MIFENPYAQWQAHGFRFTSKISAKSFFFLCDILLIGTFLGKKSVLS
jgi:hypothetical protein